MNEAKVSLGIAFAPRSFAIAVVSDSDCVFHIVQTVHPSLTIYDKLRVVRYEVLAVYRHLKPCAVTIKNPPNAQAESLFSAVAAKEVKELARRRNIIVRRIAHNAIRQFQPQSFPKLIMKHPTTAQHKALQQEALCAAILGSRRRLAKSSPS